MCSLCHAGQRSAVYPALYVTVMTVQTRENTQHFHMDTSKQATSKLMLSYAANQQFQPTEMDTGQQTCSSVQDQELQAGQLPGLHADCGSAQYTQLSYHSLKCTMCDAVLGPSVFMLQKP